MRLVTAVLLATAMAGAVRGALLYGIDNNDNVVRADTNARTLTTVANVTLPRVNSGLITALDPPPAGTGGGRFYVALFNIFNGGDTLNCVQKVLPPPPPSADAESDADPFGRDDSRATASSQVWCLTSGTANAILSLAVQKGDTTHNLYVLTASAVLLVTPQQFGANQSTVLMSPPPAGVVAPDTQNQIPVASVWDPVHSTLWFATSTPTSLFVGVKPNFAKPSASALVGPLTGSVSRGQVISVYWNGAANEFAALLSDGHYGPVDCGAARFTIDMEKMSLTPTAIWSQMGSYQDCDMAGAWTNADGPSVHGTFWTLWNNDWYEFYIYGFDMSSASANNPSATWPVGPDYIFPFSYIQPLA